MTTSSYKVLRLIVNRNFRIKVNGNGVSTLVGMDGLKKILGYERVLRVCESAMESDGNCYLYKCHNGLRIRFYVK